MVLLSKLEQERASSQSQALLYHRYAAISETEQPSMGGQTDRELRAAAAWSEPCTPCLDLHPVTPGEA